MRAFLFCGVAILLAPGLLRAQTGAFTLNGGSASQTGQIYAGTAADQSAIYVINGGNLTLVSPTVTKTGGSSDVNKSSQYGLNAGVLANTAGVVSISGGSVTTDASGSNGLFASGAGSAIAMSNGTITTTGTASHGVDVTYGGAITLTNMTVTTSGDSASAGLSTDYGGGTVTFNGGTVTTAGSKSPTVYSTGVITVSNAKLNATGGPGGVIDGANAISIANSKLTCKLNGFKVFRSAPGSGTATITIDGGSIDVTAGDVFYVTTSSGAATAVLTVKGGASLSASTGNIVNADTGSTVTFTADGETLAGNLIADSTSKVTGILQNKTRLTGMITRAALTIDSASSWNVTADSVLTSLTDSSAVSGSSVTNITGNGHLVYYDKSLAANSYLGGLTFTLANGGYLLPVGSTPVVSTLAITSVSPLAGATAGTAYSLALTASGGTAPCTWSVISGSLPQGLSLSTAGSISGTPTAVGTATFVVQAADSASSKATQTLSITVAAAPACSYSLSPGGQAFPASGGSGSIAVTAASGCAWSAAGAPAWVSISGAQSGTGSATLSYQVQANTGSARQGSIGIGGLSFALEQAAASVSGFASAGAMAQVASGGSWTTTITLINNGPSSSNLRLNFFDNKGNALTLPLTFPQGAAGPLMASTLDRTLGAGAGLVIETTGPASQTALEGWAQLLTEGAIAGFAVFASNASGSPQEAIAPLQNGNPGSWVLWFDNAGGYSTGVALANLTGQAAAIQTIARDDAGASLANDSISLGAQGHLSFMIAARFGATAGKRGSLEFQTPVGGQIEVLGIRAGAGGALTSVPPLAK